MTEGLTPFLETSVRAFRRALVLRLGLAATVVSLVLGFGAFVLETERAHSYLLGRAEREAALIARGSIIAAGQPFEDAQASLARLMADRGDGEPDHFITAEVYDLDGRMIAALTDPALAAIERQADLLTHGFPAPGETWHRKLVLGDVAVFQMLVPLRSGDGAQIGWFEGIFQLSPETLARIRVQPIAAIVAVMLAVLVTALILYPIMAAQQRELMRRASTLQQANLDTLKVLGNAIAKRDSDTHIHNYRVAIYSIRIAEALGQAPEQIRALVKGAFLHDIGKIGITDTILLKPGRLTEAEFAVMKTHVLHGHEIINASKWLKDAVDMVLHHHEKLDGSGYPHNLRGQAIPINARIFAVADVFDALTTRRPYKEPMPFAAAVAILEQGRGWHFDPMVLDAFLRIAEDLLAEIDGQDDNVIEHKLESLMRTYFPALQ